MNTHTKGPWDRIIADGYTVRHPQIYSDTGPVANATWLGDGRLDELNANARLIASAPDLLKQRDELLKQRDELLDALKGMVALYDTDEGCRSLPEYQAARDAICREIFRAAAETAKAGGAV